MRRYFERKQQLEEEQRKYLNTPVNLRLKYVAIGVISICLLLIVIMWIWIDTLSLKTWYFMRGCVGVCAIIFAVLIGILYYRVNSENLQNRWNSKQRSENE